MNVRRSLFYVFSQSYFQLGLQFVASLIIARLLTPREIGVFSVSMVLITLVNTFRDFGVVDYIVQEKNLTPERIRAASLLTFVTAWSLALLVGLSAGVVADFYREPDIAWVMRLLALNFVLLPFGSVAMAHLRRILRFDDWSRIRVASSLVQTVMSVGLAYLGMSYFSMAWGSVAAGCLTIYLTMKYREPGIDFRPGWGDVRTVFSVGGINTGINILIEVTRGLPDLLLGRLANLESVGYFSRATGLIEMFNRLVVQAAALVVMPHFTARLRQGEEVIQGYLAGISFLTAIAWPFLLFLSFNAAPVVRLLYGDQWDRAIEVLSLLALAELMLAPVYLQQQLAIASGHLRLEALRQGLILMVRALPFLILADQGVVSVATGCLLSYAMVLAISLTMLRRISSITLRDLLVALRPSFYLAILVAVGLYLCSWLAETYGLPHYAEVIICGGLIFLIWLAGLFFLRHPLSEELRNLMAKLRNGRH
jgi:O-antigen/teichoic acid export membrane protein